MEGRHMEYSWEYPLVPYAHKYLLPTIFPLLKDLNLGCDANILDAGCGRGYLLNTLYNLGFKKIWGFDISKSDIKLAQERFPKIADRFFEHDANNPDLPDGIPLSFDLIISMEVIEHLYNPSIYLKNLNRYLKQNKYLVITTPYNGYLKNLLLAISCNFDRHFDSLSEGGHIKFFTRKTLSLLLTKEGFGTIRFEGAGRVPYIWKSMVLIAKKIK